MPEISTIILSIYDVNGRLIEVLENTTRQSGNYSNVSSGVYLFRIQAGNLHQVRKCLRCEGGFQVG
ncbi:T9SS type A sorting domain-containing protein [bacterium]|nr:T9SS type A sorting domain-containing protein [bacterium]MBU1064136.1 T9SS type A sorting domain-containing protein [bacterium]MBU1634884.1 T9SS type A sorting domain-containing protein [bacterium]MBU1872673.1 T9SS type A sorting domain-containing protein [bacterium]